MSKKRVLNLNVKDNLVSEKISTMVEDENKKNSDFLKNHILVVKPQNNFIDKKTEAIELIEEIKQEPDKLTEEFLENWIEEEKKEEPENLINPIKKEEKPEVLNLIEKMQLLEEKLKHFEEENNKLKTQKKFSLQETKELYDQLQQLYKNKNIFVETQKSINESIELLKNDSSEVLVSEHFNLVLNTSKNFDNTRYNDVTKLFSIKNPKIILNLLINVQNLINDEIKKLDTEIIKIESL